MLFGVTHQGNTARMQLHERGKNLERAVGRAVIANVQMEIFAGLPEQRFELFPQKPRAIVGRKQYCNLSTIPFHSLSKRTTNANYSRYVYP